MDRKDELLNSIELRVMAIVILPIAGFIAGVCIVVLMSQYI